MFIEIERITTTTYIKDINLIDTNMMGNGTFLPK